MEEPNPDDAYSPFFTDYSYYAFGPLHEVSQGGQTRTFTYDWLGRKLNEVHPETATSTGHDYSYAYTYNDAGLLTSRTDVRGIQTDYSYDNINRLTGINYYDTTPDITLTYDQGGYTGLLTTAAVTGVKSSSFAYNTAGNLASEAMTLTGADGTFTTSYTYDYDGRLLSATYPSGRLVTSSYAAGTYASDRLASLSANYLNSPILLQSITANAAGLLTSRTIGDGLTQAQSYNPRNQITRIAAAANGTTLLDLGFSYGSSNDGRIHTRTDAVQPEHSAAYTYDPIGRLTEVAGTSSSWGVSWTMDRWGNRTHQYPDSSGLASTRQIGTQNFAYPNGNNRNSDWSYDAAGNVTNDGTNYYCYDAENRLTELSTSCSGTGSTRYVYDEAGRRIKKIALEDESSVTTYYFYGLTGLMSEFSTSTARSNHTVAASNDRVVYPVGEQTGTPVMLVASDGTPRENNRVFPYGQSWNAVTNSESDQKFTTYQRDASGLDYAMARHYDKVVGRFLTPDPGHVGASIDDPQSWNPYVYVRNNPVILTDPSGKLFVICDTEAACVDNISDLSFQLNFELNPSVLLSTNPRRLGATGSIKSNDDNKTLLGSFYHLSIDGFDMSNFDFFLGWASGALPEAISYGPYSDATGNMMNSSTVQQKIFNYVQGGCGDSAAIGTDHLQPFFESVFSAIDHRRNPTQFQVGAWSGSIKKGDNGVYTITITNTASWGSFIGVSALTNTNYANNPFNIDAPGIHIASYFHNVDQTFRFGARLDCQR